MLEDVLNSVKEAERLAAERIADAEQQAQEELRANQQGIDELWQDSKTQAKIRRANTLSEATMTAEAAAVQIAAEYAERAEDLRREGLTKVDALVDYLTEKIFNGDC